MEQVKSEYENTEIKRFNKMIKGLFDNYIKEDGFICGGFARVCITKKDNYVPCSDVDIYTKNVEAFERIKSRLLANAYSEGKSSDAAISMKYAFDGTFPIQLIKPLNTGHVHLSDEDVKQILNNFDFTITRAGIYKNKDGELTAICDSDFHIDDKENKLHIKGIHCPVAQVYRVNKYTQKGYRIRTLEVIKILEDWEERPESYKTKIIDTLRNEDPSQEEINEMEKLLHID